MFLMGPLQKTLLVPYCNQSPGKLLESCDQRPATRRAHCVWHGCEESVMQRPGAGSTGEASVLRVMWGCLTGSSNLVSSRSSSPFRYACWCLTSLRVQVQLQPKVRSLLSNFLPRWQTLNYCHQEPCIPGSSQPLMTAWQMMSFLA